MYYFGALGGRVSHGGHRWYDVHLAPYGRNRNLNIEKHLRIPDNLYAIIDQFFCIPNKVEGVCTCTHISDEEEETGKVHAYTVMAFWDQSGDNRPGSNSAFLFKGTHSFETMVMLADSYFPDITSRFKFPLIEADPNMYKAVEKRVRDHVEGGAL